MRSFNIGNPLECRFYRDKQHKNRIESAWKTALSADILMFVVDAHRQILKPDPRVLQQVANLNSMKFFFEGAQDDPALSLVLNKVDLLAKEERKSILLLTDELRSLANFQEIFYVSALRRKGIDDLRGWLLSKAKPSDLPTPDPGDWGLDKRDIASEILREKIFRAYYKGEKESTLFFRSFMTRRISVCEKLWIIKWTLCRNPIPNRYQFGFI